MGVAIHDFLTCVVFLIFKRTWFQWFSNHDSGSNADSDNF